MKKKIKINNKKKKKKKEFSETFHKVTSKQHCWV